MKTTVDIPDQLYRQAKIRAVETGQTLKQLVLISLSREMSRPREVLESGGSYRANRKLLPDYEQALKEGAFSGGTDSTQIVSEERDAR